METHNDSYSKICSRVWKETQHSSAGRGAGWTETLSRMQKEKQTLD